MTVSIKEELAKVEEFVRHFSKHEDIIGFDLYPSNKHIYTTYILAKVRANYGNKTIGALEIKMDCFNPTERPLIVNAINRGVEGRDLDAETLENEMVSKSTNESELIH